MIKQFLTLIICCLISAFAFAAEPKTAADTDAKMNITESGVYMADFTTDELQKMFAYLQYDEYINPPETNIRAFL